MDLLQIIGKVNITEKTLLTMGIKSIALIAEGTMRPSLVIRYTDGREDSSIREEKEVAKFLQEINAIVRDSKIDDIIKELYGIK